MGVKEWGILFLVYPVLGDSQGNGESMPQTHFPFYLRPPKERRGIKESSKWAREGKRSGGKGEIPNFRKTH